MLWPVQFVALSIALCITGAIASKGDRDPAFQYCLRDYISRNCPNDSGMLMGTFDIPEETDSLWPLWITRWTCQSNAKYQCMHTTDAQLERQGAPSVQYYGKWPFTRFIGIQEPASVLFSILNFWAHARWLYTINRLEVTFANEKLQKLRMYYAGAILFGMNTWIWSAIFHTRDLPFTERMDYFSAAAGILYSVFYSCVRIFSLTNKTRARNALAFLIIIIFILHVTYLTHWQFDYTYNMIFGVLAGAVFNLLWIGWGLKQIVYHRQWHGWRPIAWALGISAAMGLELFDFPPLLKLIDAHSLWHLATIPLIGWWYKFLVIDAAVIANEAKIHEF